MSIKYYSIAFFFIALITLNVFIPGRVSAQTEPVVSVDPAFSYLQINPYATEKPVRYGDSRAIRRTAAHSLDSLTSFERGLIEAEISPPAYGILRSFSTPLRFSMKEAPTPGVGETLFAGGYLYSAGKDTTIWTTRFSSRGADILRIFFSEGYFPSGVKVSIFNDLDFALSLQELEGRVGEYGFYAPSVFSDHVTVEVMIPPDAAKDSLWFVIPSIIHAENRYIDQTDNSVPCQEDVNCSYANGYANILMLKRSTARLSFVEGSLYYLCSGGLINDSRSLDYQPFLLTANHCFSTQASANSLESWFDYYTTSCNGPNNNGYIIVSGSNLIKTNSQSDFTMVLLKQYPSYGYNGRWFLGWNTGSIANNATLHSVHHPAGVRQRYSKLQNKTSPAFNCGTTHFHHTTTLGGGSEGGSSGGTVVNESGQIVGQLYGKCYSGTYNDCSYSTFNSIWGKFSSSYNNNNLAYWLNNGGASVSMTNSPASSLSFGNVNVGTNATLSVTVTNNGTVPNYMNLEAGAVTITGTNAADFSIVGSTSLYLSPGQSGTIQVRFTPSGAGAKTAVLNIPHNANNITSPRTLTLSGTGISVCKTCPDYDAVISPGEQWSTITATLPEGGCKVYQMSVTDGMTYTFQTGCSNGATANFDTYLTLLGMSCQQVTTDDDGCESYRSRIIWEANYSGTVYLKVSGYGGAGGYYSLAFQAQPPALVACSNVIPINGSGPANTNFFFSSGSGLWTENNITCDTYCYGSEQVYSFLAPADGWYRIRVPYATGMNPFVSFMWRANECYIENWEEWSCFGILNIGETSQPSYWTAGTTYYIALDAIEYDPFLFQDMTFYLDYSAHCPDHDFNLVMENTWQLHSSYTTLNDPVRIYKIDVQSGNTYIFKTGCGDGASATFLTHLKMEDGNCNQIAEGNNSLCPSRSYLEWIADTTGTVFLTVTGQLVNGTSGYYRDYGNFTLAWREVSAEIPNDLTLQNATVESDTSECHDAYANITVAGGGTTYTVNSGGESLLVAGLKISLLPGTRVMPGGRLHAWITPDSTFCPGPLSPVTPNQSLNTSINPGYHANHTFRIYPNPVEHRFSIEPEQNDIRDYRVQIHAITGACLMNLELRGRKQYEIDISDFAPGIYILQIITGETAVSAKIVKR